MLNGDSAVEDENIARAKAMLAAEGPHDGRERPKNDDAEFTDSRLSKRLAVGLEASGKPVLYVPGLGWLTWTGKLWEPTEEEFVKGVLKMTCWRGSTSEVRAGVSAERRAHLNALLSDPRQNRLLSSLKAEVARKASDFDRHPDLLNCQNGVVNLRNGELLRHDPKLLLTKITPVPYEPDAKWRDWERILKAMPEDHRDYLLTRLGQAITGYTPTDDKAIFLDGVGGNGKSTFLDPVRLPARDLRRVGAGQTIAGQPERPADRPNDVAWRAVRRD